MRTKISVSKKIALTSILFLFFLNTSFSQDSIYPPAKSIIDSSNISDDFYFVPQHKEDINKKSNQNNTTKPTYNIYRNGLVNRPTHYINWWYRGLVW